MFLLRWKDKLIINYYDDGAAQMFIADGLVWSASWTSWPCELYIPPSLRLHQGSDSLNYMLHQYTN